MIENPNVLSHVSIGVSDMARASRFYDAVLATLGCTRQLDADTAIAYGRVFPEFWVQTPIDGEPATVGNGSHIGFAAASAQVVDAFFAAAVAAGAKPDGKPGARPHYGEAYYGCFVRDLDGHKIEATYWDASKGEHM